MEQRTDQDAGDEQSHVVGSLLHPASFMQTETLSIAKLAFISEQRIAFLASLHFFNFCQIMRGIGLIPVHLSRNARRRRDLLPGVSRPCFTDHRVMRCANDNCMSPRLGHYLDLETCNLRNFIHFSTLPAGRGWNLRAEVNESADLQ